MTDFATSALTVTRREPWNKGKVIGAKPPLRPKHVWSIRTKLQVDGRIVSLRPGPPCWVRLSDV
jgi:hypothetical protein